MFFFLTNFSKKKRKNYGILSSRLSERERGRERYRSAVGPMGRNSQGNWGLGKSVREREKGRGGAKMLKVQGVKAAAQKWRGKGIGGKKKKEREFMYTSLCVRVKEHVNRLFVIKRLVYFLGA